MPTADTTHTPTYSPGLEGVLAGETALCQVDEGEGGLRYRGYAVSDLADKATFEEVAYLLLFGKLPTQKELNDFSTQLATQSVLHGFLPTDSRIQVIGKCLSLKHPHIPG